MKPYTLAITALLAAAPVFAQTPSDESVQKLITLSQQETMFENMMDTFAVPMRQYIVSQLWSNMPKDLVKQLSPEQKQRLEAAATGLYDKFLQLYKQPEFKEKIMNLVRQTYQKHYTQEEVDYLIRYLDSPIGQRVLTKQKNLAAAAIAATSPLFEAETEKHSEKMIADFVAEAKAIVGETPAPARKPAKTQKKQTRKAKP